MVGQAVFAEGKTTKIQLMQGQYRNDITRVIVHGREELTCAENARDGFVLRMLQGKITMSNRTLIDLVWFGEILTKTLLWEKVCGPFKPPV